MDTQQEVGLSLVDLRALVHHLFLKAIEAHKAGNMDLAVYFKESARLLEQTTDEIENNATANGLYSPNPPSGS
ncbi:hypothetical protein GCM10027040_36250 [Halomonas shantousis]